MVYVLPLLCYLGALVASLIAVRRRATGLVWGVMAVCVVAFVWAILTGRGHQGWDAIGFTILAVLVVLPVFLGAVTGLLTGVYRSRRDRQKARHD